MHVNLDDVLQVIDAMPRYFRGGHGWGQFMLHNPLNGRKCLMGAVSAVRASDGNSSWVPSEEIAVATEFILRAVREHGFAAIEDFNDTRRSYRQIAAVMERAKQLAMQDAARQWQMQAAQKRPALTHQPQEAMPVVKITLADLERVALPRKK
jgi:hypothetical protein